MRPVLEFMRFTTVRTLDDAVDVVQAAGHPPGPSSSTPSTCPGPEVPRPTSPPSIRRCSPTPSSATPPARSPPTTASSAEALDGRLLPGDGVLPLDDLMSALSAVDAVQHGAALGGAAHGLPRRRRAGPGRAGRLPGHGRRRSIASTGRWSDSAWSVSPTPARARSTTRSRAVAPWPPPTPSPPRTPTSASPRCRTSDSTGWPRCPPAATSCTPPSRSSTSAAWSRAPARARASATASWPTSARSTPSCFVLRAFVDDDVTGPSDPLEHLRVVELELALADLETVEKRLSQIERQSKLDRSLGDELAALQAANDALAEGRPLYRAGLTAEHRATLAPALPADQPPRPGRRQRRRGRPRPDARAGSGRARRADRRRRRRRDDRHVRAARGRGGGDRGPGRAGRDAGRASGSEKARCSGWSAAPTTCSACARSSPPGTRRAGPGRSWTDRRRRSAPGGSTPTSSGGFIRAEVIDWQELLDIGSWTKAKEVGKIRLEGKDYVARDGDVMEFRFNV